MPAKTPAERLSARLLLNGWRNEKRYALSSIADAHPVQQAQTC